MGEPVLLLRFEGPLQSWGLRARWDVRDSAREPTKSGVVGLLAAALGYGRDDPRIASELEAGLRMGVRVEREGGVLGDYHTVSGYLPMANGGFKAAGGHTARQIEKLIADPDAAPYTVQSSRRYITDGAFLIALSATAAATPGLLTRCADALRRPHWPLFLGRRCCVPTRPVMDRVADGYVDLDDALERHPWSCLGADGELRREGFIGARQLRVVMESSAGAARDDRRQSGGARLYGRRWVRERFVPVPVRAIVEDL